MIKKITEYVDRIRSKFLFLSCSLVTFANFRSHEYWRKLYYISEP